MRKILCGIILGTSGLLAGCSGVSEPSFAMRNAEANLDLDLQSLVRTQSNDLLALTQELESHAKRDFASSKRLDRDLEEAATQMDQLHMNLPALLAAQDVEIAELREGIRQGTVQKTALNARSKSVQSYRKALLGSLIASASRANLTAVGLSEAHQSGRTDLAHHSQTATDIARDLKAARTMIEMQL